MKAAFFNTKPYDIPWFRKSADGTDLELKFYESRLTADSAQLASGYEAICVFVNDILDAKVIDRLVDSGVRLIALRCAGYNNVDIAYCAGKIGVVHVPAYSPYAVAEHTMALLLTSVRRIHKAYNRTREFNFSLNGLTGFDLHGKTVGVIGSGKIGSVFGDICRGFGMRTIAYSKTPKTGTGFEFVSLDELYAQSDIISLHCPLTPETENLINAQAIEKMKKGVILLNTSRGKLVDTDALIDGLKDRKIGAACLDVYAEEGNLFYNDFSGHIVNDDKLTRLISMPNVLVTGHQAYLTEEALNNIAETTVQNILTYFSGKEICENELVFRDGEIVHRK